MQAVIVLGPFRGGTSVATGILQALGVFVGECFLDAETGYPTYEAVKLREQCLRCFDERENYWGYLCTKQQRVEHLRERIAETCGLDLTRLDDAALLRGRLAKTTCLTRLPAWLRSPTPCSDQLRRRICVNRVETIGLLRWSMYEVPTSTFARNAMTNGNHIGGPR